MTIIKVRKGLNGYKYSACDKNGRFIGNFEKLGEVRKTLGERDSRGTCCAYPGTG